MKESELNKGAISWMARNPVAANLLMLILIFGGIIVGRGIKQEIFPEFEMNFVSVVVAYPGASPAEVEQGVVLAMEEAVHGIDGVKRVFSIASEGAGSVIVELSDSVNPNKCLADIKNAVDRIRTFPRDSEEPQVRLLSNRHQAVSLVVYGDQPKRELRAVAESLRMRLQEHPDVTLVELSGIRPLEVSIEIPQNTLRAYGLTLDGVAQQIARTSLELPAGGIKTSGGEILVRTDERRNRASEFKEISILSGLDGTSIRLGDIATVKDGYTESFVEAYFNGKPAVVLNVFRVGKQTPIQVVDAAMAVMEAMRPDVPPGIEMAPWQDWSEMYRDRIGLLMKNAKLGLILVLLILGLFLEFKLAFWVTMGIPISFLGSMFLMPAMNISINMISLFAFIVTLGMVVDDAIVVGENVFENRQKGMPPLKAAILGAKQVAVPVTFSILTTIAAFMPLFFVPGVSGKLFRVIPAIVVSVLLISLVESLFVLPAHLGHQKQKKLTGIFGFLSRQQKRVSGSMVWFARSMYGPVLKRVVRNRYITIAVALAALITSLGYIGGGHINFNFMPRVESDHITATANLWYGVPIERTREIQEKLVAAAEELIEESGGPDISRGVFTLIGAPMLGGGPVNYSKAIPGSHLLSVRVYLVKMDQRSITASEFSRRWREKVGEIADVESLKYKFSIGPSGGNPVDLQLSHEDTSTLERAAAELAEGLESYGGVFDIDDGVAGGKPQLNLKLNPEAESLGLTTIDVARQTRASFYGAEARRQQRGRHELRVMVRLPERERQSEYDIEELLVRTPMGSFVPLREVAQVQRSQAYTLIRRENGRRVINVTADIVPAITSGTKVRSSVESRIIPELLKKYRGLSYSVEGEQRSQKESLDALQRGFMLAMLVIFALLAIPFKSYVQPFVVMAAIPFGIIGALLGHIAMGFDLSIISAMGIVALSGVVINDSLVLVHAANREKSEGSAPEDAIVAAGIRRFRPILLTSLTTFFGLAPMIIETSVQARFLIPMAISLGFGVLFATFIILLLIPCLYMAVEDLSMGARRLTQFLRSDDDSSDVHDEAVSVDPVQEDGIIDT
jgi:multidrug efflux pump subunit AcrB